MNGVIRSLFALALSVPLFAAETTYYFSGTFSAGSPTSLSIPAGTAFTGTMTFDPTTPHTSAADSQHRNYADPLASIDITIGSNLYHFVATPPNAVGMEEDANYGLNFGGGSVIWFWANSPTITGTGAVANPLLPSVVSCVLLWSKPAGGILADANSFTDANILNLAQWTFAGLDFSVLQGGINGEHYRGAFASFSTTPPVSADVTITKTATATINAGQNLVYTTTVINSGPSSAAAVVVTDPTPANLTFVSNTGACTTTFPCNLGTLNNGQSVIITSTYSTQSSFAGNISNTATVSSSTTDPNPNNNSSTFTTNVLGQADVSITMTGPAQLHVGPNSYTITVTNNGPGQATGVVVNDPAPAGLTFASNTGACTAVFPCNLGNLNNGQSATITATFNIATSINNNVVNTATVSTTSNDPNQNNNTTTSTDPPVIAPVPTSLLLTGFGLGIAFLWRRRRV